MKYTVVDNRILTLGIGLELLRTQQCNVKRFCYMKTLLAISVFLFENAHA